MSNSSNTQNGRSQAKERRQARKAGATSAIPTRATRGAPKQPAAPIIAPQATAQTAAVGNSSTRSSVNSQQPVVASAGREASKQRRKQTQRGQASSQANTNTGRVRKKPEPIIEPRSSDTSTTATMSTSAPKARSTVNDAKSGRAQVKSTATSTVSSGRQVSKAKRKAQAQKGKTGETSYKSSGNQASMIAKLANPDASSREVARSVRAERCTRGKSGCSSSTTSDAAKNRKNRKSRAGGASEKVGFSETLSGQGISGTQVGQSGSTLTGAETGACQVVSGTEYLGTEEFASSCSETPAAAPSKVTTTQTTKGQTISGNRMGQAKAVSGDRTGICSGVTGTNYLPADQGSMFCGSEATVTKPQGGFTIAPGPSASANAAGNKVSGGNDFPVQSGSIQPSSGDTSETPKKVMMSSTFAGVGTSGTQVGRTDTSVTGVEEGYCQAVTGTGYQGQEEVEAVCNNTAPSKPVNNPGVSGSFSSRQDVTGDRSSSPLRASGSNAGGFSVATSIVDQSGVMPGKPQVETVTAGHPLTGAQPGPQGLTGAQTGACELVSGTQYQGVDQTALMCESANAAIPGESDFPIMFGNAAPVDMSQPLPSPEPVVQANTITGDGWDSGSKVTGTNGPSAMTRNPSIRGNAGQPPMNASTFRPTSMEEVPTSPITGSAGNYSDGAKVTLSGGARA